MKILHLRILRRYGFSGGIGSVGDGGFDKGASIGDDAACDRSHGGHDVD